MKRKSTIEPFDSERFIADLKHITSSIDAPYSETHVEEVLQTFGQNLADGAIALRTTNRPNDALNFWVGEYNRVDTISQAVKAGIVTSENPSVMLLRAWFNKYEQAEPSTDFDTAKGLAKTWIYFMKLQPVEEVLSVEGVPDSFRRHIETFKRLEAKMVYHVAVSYHSGSVNIYLQIPHAFSAERVTSIIEALLPECSVPIASEVEQMMKCMREDMPIVFAVTLSYPTGSIERTCFYAFLVSRQAAKEMGIGTRLERFLEVTPCYDEREVLNFGWSFGRNGDRYLKMDIGYCGGFCDILEKLKHF